MRHHGFWRSLDLWRPLDTRGRFDWVGRSLSTQHNHRTRLIGRALLELEEKEFVCTEPGVNS